MKKKIVIFAAVILLLALFCGCNRIPSGYTGVKIVDGVVQDEPMSAGRYGHYGPRTEIVRVNNQRQTKVYASSGYISGESNSQVVVYAANISITYQINPEASVWLVKNVSDNFREVIIPSTKVTSAIKNVMAQLDTQKCTNRSFIEPAAKIEIQNALDEYYYPGAVTVYDVSIGSMDFEDSYNEQIAKISNLQKQAEAEAITNQMKIDAARADAEAETMKAEAAKKTAEANAEIARIEAESYAETHITIAEADVERMRMIIEVLTPEYIEYIRAYAWDGALPHTVVSDDSAILFGQMD